MCWRLSAPGLCNAHFPAAQDISQCSQAEVAQRVPERKPKIGLPIYLSAAIDPFTAQPGLLRALESIHKTRSRPSLSLYAVFVLVEQSYDSGPHGVRDRTVVSELLWYYFWATQSGAWDFSGRKWPKQKALMLSYIQIQIYSAFLHVSPVEEDVTWHYVLYTKTNIFNVGYFLRWIN